MTVTAGQGGPPNIRPAGGDFRRGERLAAPRRLRPADLGLLAAMNAARLTVARRPVVALIPTGDELVAPGEDPGPDQIVSSNDIALEALLEAAGATGRRLPIARDTPGSLAATLDLAAGADLIVTIGGASVGDFDLVRATAETHGLVVDFHGVAMRPGKPLLAGRLGGVPLVGLPGNPASAFVTAHLFLRPAIERMLGLPGDPPAPHAARLAAPGRAERPARPLHARPRRCRRRRRLDLHAARLAGQLAGRRPRRGQRAAGAPGARSRPRRRRNRRVHLAVTNRRLYRAKILDTNQERN